MPPGSTNTVNVLCCNNTDDSLSRLINVGDRSFVTDGSEFCYTMPDWRDGVAVTGISTRKRTLVCGHYFVVCLLRSAPRRSLGFLFWRHMFFRRVFWQRRHVVCTANTVIAGLRCRLLWLVACYVMTAVFLCFIATTATERTLVPRSTLWFAWDISDRHQRRRQRSNCAGFDRHNTSRWTACDRQTDRQTRYTWVPS